MTRQAVAAAQVMAGHLYRIGWEGLSITVRSPLPDLWSALDGQRDPLRLSTFLVERLQSAEGAVDVVHLPASEPSVELDSTGLLLRGPVAYWSQHERLGCVLLSLLDRMLLRRRQLVLHGAVVEIDGKGVLLTGPSDSGKTSVMYELCARHGAGFMSNDHVVVDCSGPTPVALPGADHQFAFRSQAVWLSNPDRYRQLYGEGGLRSYERHRVDASELGVRVVTDPVPLTRVFFVGVGTTESGTVYPTPDVRARVQLHADAAGRIRATNLLLFDESGEIGVPLPDLADEETTGAVTASVQRLVDSGIVYDLRGTPRWCADAVVSAVRSEACR